MPSPTSSTRPTCSLWIEGLKALDALAEYGRDVLGVDREFGHELDLLLQLVETVTDRAVDHRVSDRRDDAAEYRLVDDHLHLDPLARRSGQRGGDAVALTVVERDGGAHLGDCVLAGERGELDEAIDDGGQVVPAARRRR